MAIKKRSPKYPFINLEAALSRAEVLRNKEGFSFVPATVAAQHWGYAEKSSGGLQTIATLISYGLLEDQGSGKERKVKLTELSRNILLDKRPESIEREHAIRQAALNPKLFAELWSTNTDNILPSDENLHHLLVFQLDFNEKSVPDVIRKFKETVTFAKLSESSVNSDDDFSNEHGNKAGVDFSGDEKHTKPPKRERPPGMNEDISTIGDSHAVLQWPNRLTQEDYDEFEIWLDLMKRKAKRAIIKDDPEQAPNDGNE